MKMGEIKIEIAPTQLKCAEKEAVKPVPEETVIKDLVAEREKQKGIRIDPRGRG